MTGHPVLLALILSSTPAIPQAALPGPAQDANRCATSENSIPLHVSVEDRSGARIPRAWIRIDPKDSGHFCEIRADQAGKAIIPLQSGNYTASVIAAGFKKWTKVLTIEPGKEQRIDPQLDIGDVGWGPVIEEEKTIPLERTLPLAVITYLPLETVALPSRRVRERSLLGFFR